MYVLMLMTRTVTVTTTQQLGRDSPQAETCTVVLLLDTFVNIAGVSMFLL